MYCKKCGTALPSDAAFCPRCGTPVTATPAAPPSPPSHSAPPPVVPVTDATQPRFTARAIPPSSSTAAPVARKRQTPWWIVPAVIIGLLLLAWLVIAGLPFGRDEAPAIEARTETETIAEGRTEREPGTVLDVPGTLDDEPDSTATMVVTTTTVAPPVPTTTRTPPAPAPKPVATPVPAPGPVATATGTVQIPRQTPPVTPKPAPTPAPTPARFITEAEAAAELRGYLTSRNFYDVASSCVRLNGRGLRNEGYGFDVWHACAGGGASRLLGRWRVDAKTRELFRQREDGRYLSP